MKLPYGDLRVIAAAPQTLKAGLDPYVQNQFDPWQRPFNYPRIWLALGDAMQSEERLRLVGRVMALLSFASLFVLLPRLSLLEGAWISLIFCSPAMALAVERGNTDLLVLAVTTLAVGLVVAARPAVRSIGYALLLLATVAKLYPLAGLVLISREPASRRWTLLAFAASVLAGTILLSWRELVLVAENTPVGNPGMSYGSKQWALLAAYYAQNWGYQTDIEALRRVGQWASVMVVALGFWRARPSIPLTPGPWRLPDGAFVVGAGIYLGTFILGNSFNYRALFLLLVLPACLEGLRRGGASRLSAALQLQLVVAVLFLDGVRAVTAWTIGEVASWVLLAILSHRWAQLALWPTMTNLFPRPAAKTILTASDAALNER